MVDNLSMITGGEPYVVMGDFNFFPDAGRSVEQEALMAADHDDVFVAARELDTGLPFTRTFVGFPNDPFKCPNIYSLDALGRLDRAYTRRGDTRVCVTEPLIDTRLFLHKKKSGDGGGDGDEDGDEDDDEDDDGDNRVGRWDFPSDHFPLVMKVSVTTQNK